MRYGPFDRLRTVSLGAKCKAIEDGAKPSPSSQLENTVYAGFTHSESGRSEEGEVVIAGMLVRASSGMVFPDPILSG